MIGLILFAIVGAIVARGRPTNGFFYRSAGEWIGALVIGAIIAFVALAIVGSILYWLSQRRGREDKTWGEVTLGWAAMGGTLVLLLASAAGRAAQHQDALHAAKPNPSGSLTEREKANLDAQDWSRSRKPLLNEFIADLRQNPGFLKVFTAKGNTPAVRHMAARIEHGFQDGEARWRALPPSPLTDLRAVDAGIIHAISLAQDAYADYVAGLNANVASGIPMKRDKESISILDRGDVKFNHSVALLRQLGKRLLVLDKKYSGIP